MPFRRRLKDLRRTFGYYTALGPSLSLLERVPAPVLRSLLALLEPLAHAAIGGVSRRHLAMVYGDALPPAERQRIARAVTRHLALGVGELLTAVRIGPERLDERIDDADARRMLARLEAGSTHGFLALTGHVGNWELLGSWLARHSSRGGAAAIAKRQRNARFNTRIEALRLRLGLATIYRDDAPAHAIRALREGRVIAVVPDQDVKNVAGMFVDFLGHRAYTPLGPARLALAAGVPIVCGFMLRTDGGRYRIEVGEPIWPDRSAPRAEEVERLTRAWSAAVEAVIRSRPEQWAWFHERWRTTPELLLARGRRELEL